ncbi:hypothetical protein [Streptomyces griseus]|uniref:hypothetical protein n=1 Tax=Streptomyces griseus TaxID=1911 RepID=UPI000A4A05EF|nr:hypothetical protein [Streptomyces griseus]
MYPGPDGGRLAQRACAELLAYDVFSQASVTGALKGVLGGEQREVVPAPAA